MVQYQNSFVMSKTQKNDTFTGISCFGGWIKHYHSGMLKYDQDNPPTLFNQWKAFTDEFVELIEAFINYDLAEIWAEFNDCIHAFLRIIVIILWSIPFIGSYLIPVIILIPIIGFKTAKKHAIRFKKNGCIRSSRHCINSNLDHICNRSVNSNTNDTKM